MYNAFSSAFELYKNSNKNTEYLKKNLNDYKIKNKDNLNVKPNFPIALIDCNEKELIEKNIVNKKNTNIYIQKITKKRKKINSNMKNNIFTNDLINFNNTYNKINNTNQNINMTQTINTSINKPYLTNADNSLKNNLLSYQNSYVESVDYTDGFNDKNNHKKKLLNNKTIQKEKIIDKKILEDSNCAKLQSVYTHKSPSDIFYMSKTSNEYFSMDFFEFSKKIKILQCKFKSHPEKLIKILNKIRIQNKLFNKVEENAVDFFNDKIEENKDNNLILKKKDIYLAGNYGNIIPLLRSISKQIKVKYSQEDIEFLIRSINPKRYVNSYKTMSSIRLIEHIDGLSNQDNCCKYLNTYGDDIDYYYHKKDSIISNLLNTDCHNKTISTNSNHIHNKNCKQTKYKRDKSSKSEKINKLTALRVISNMKLKLDYYDENDPDIKIFEQAQEIIIDGSKNEVNILKSKDYNIVFNNNNQKKAVRPLTGKTSSLQYNNENNNIKCNFRPKTGKLSLQNKNKINSIESEIIKEADFIKEDDNTFDTISNKDSMNIKNELSIKTKLPINSYHYKNMNMILKKAKNKEDTKDTKNINNFNNSYKNINLIFDNKIIKNRPITSTTAYTNFNFNKNSRPVTSKPTFPVFNNNLLSVIKIKKENKTSKKLFINKKFI